jgi:DNA-binding FadR family transcriptional regulator
MPYSGCRTTVALRSGAAAGAGGIQPEYGGGEGGRAMTETPLREVRRVVYRPLRGGNALEDTVARLVQTIRLGVVAPGESLPPERELAGRYEVSRDTVREAIRELADTGYLVRRRGRYGGTFVADPLPPAPHPGVVPLDELDDVLGLRRVIEAGAARTAAGRTLTPEARTELWSRHEAASGADAADYRRLDTLLHLTIAELAGIPSLVAIAAENRARINAWLDTFPLLPRNIEHSNAQHERIVAAILAGRADAAETAILEHLAGSEALLRGFLG